MDNSKSIGMLRRGQPEQDYVFSIFFLSISYTVSKVKHHPYIILKMYMLKNVLQSTTNVIFSFIRIFLYTVNPIIMPFDSIA